MRCLLFLPLLLPCVLSRAQDLHTIYYKNGKKAMEGRWSYTYEAYFSNSLAVSIMISREGLDVEPQLKSRQEWGMRRQAPTLSILPEGLIKTWYSTGMPKAEITFKAGRADGPYKSYYRDGTSAEAGTLRLGQPDGEWKCYSRNGDLYFSGTYTACGQDALDAQWKALFREYDHTPDSAESSALSKSSLIHNNDAPEDSQDPDVKWSASDLLRPFTNLDVAAERISVRNGVFNFLFGDGNPLAQLAYTNGVRTGTWEYYNRPGHRALSITFDHGRIISSTDSSGNRQSIAQLRQQWKKDAAARANGPEVIAAPDVPVFKYVEETPKFKGDLASYISSHLKYPAGSDNIEGKVYVEFIVQTDGSIASARVTRALSRAFDAEALRMVRAMPKWTPGKNNGQSVACYFALPVVFRRD